MKMKIYIVEVRLASKDEAGRLWGELNNKYGQSAQVREVEVEV